MNKILCALVSLLVLGVGAPKPPPFMTYSGPTERKVIPDINTPTPGSFENAYPRWLSPTMIGNPVYSPSEGQEVIDQFLYPALAVDSRNTVYMAGRDAFNFVVCDNRYDTRRSNGFSAFTNLNSVSLQPPSNFSMDSGGVGIDIAVGPDDTVHVVWAQLQSGVVGGNPASRTDIWYSIKGPAGWSTPVSLTSAGWFEYYRLPHIRVDYTGIVHVATTYWQEVRNQQGALIAATGGIAHQTITAGAFNPPMVIPATINSWNSPQGIGSPNFSFGGLRMADPRGSTEAWIVYSHFDSVLGGTAIRFVHGTGAAWSSVVDVSNRAMNASPDISLESNLTPHFVWNLILQGGGVSFFYKEGSAAASAYSPPIVAPRIVIDSRNQVHVLGASTDSNYPGITYLARVKNPNPGALSNGFYRQPLISAPYNGNYLVGGFATMALTRNDQIHYAVMATDQSAPPAGNDHVIYTRTMEYNPVARDPSGTIPAFPGGVVNATNGNLHAEVSMFRTAGIGPAQAPSLIYNSLEPFSGFVAPGWKLNYEIYLIDHWGRLNNPDVNQIDGLQDAATVFFPDGRAVHFRYRTYMEGSRELSYMEPLEEYGFSAKLERLAMTYQPTYRLILKDGTVYLFNMYGKLTNIQDPSGYYILLTYNSAGQVSEIRDQIGHGRTGRATSLGYEMTGDQRRTPRITGLTDPLSRQYTLTYDGQRLDTLRYSSVPSTPTYNFDYYTNEEPVGARINLMSRFSTPRGNAGNYGYTLKYFPDNRVLKVEDPSEVYLLDGEGDLATPTAHVANLAFTYDETTSDMARRITAYTDRRANWTRFEVEPRRSLVLDLRDPLVLADWTGPSSDPPNPPAGLSPVTHVFDNYGNLTEAHDRWGVKTTHVYFAPPVDLRYAVDTVDNVQRETAGSSDLETLENFTYMTYSNGSGLMLFRFSRLASATIHETPTGSTMATPRTTSYSYDFSTGLLKTVTHPDVTRPDGNSQSNVTTGYMYGGGEELSSVTDELGNTTTFSQFDAIHGLPQSLVRPPAGSQAETMQYNVMGFVTQHTLPQGGAAGQANENVGTSITAYDNMHRVQTITDPKGTVTTYEYDLDSNCTSVSPPSGAGTPVGTIYDKRGFASEGSGPDGPWAQWVNASGSVRRIQNVRGYVSNSDYDSLERVTEARTPGGSTLPSGQGGGGPATHTTNYQYDLMVSGAHHSKITRLGSTNRVTETTHDKFGRPIEVLQPDLATKIRTIYSLQSQALATETYYNAGSGMVLQTCTLTYRDNRGRVDRLRRQDVAYLSDTDWEENSYWLRNKAGFVEKTVGPRGDIATESDWMDKVAYVPDDRQRLYQIQEYDNGSFITLKQITYGDDDLPIEIKVPDPTAPMSTSLVTAVKYTYSSRKETWTVKNASNLGNTFIYGTHPGQLDHVTDAENTTTQINNYADSQRVQYTIEANGTSDERKREYVWTHGLNTQVKVWNPTPSSGGYNSEYNMFYDKAGRLERYTTPLVATQQTEPERFVYNDFGELYQHIQGPRTVTQGYSPLGQLTTSSWASPYSVTVSRQYDGAGNPTRVDDGSLRKDVAWNVQRGIPTSTTLYVGGSSWRSFSHDFDAGGLEQKLTYPDPSSTDYEWVRDVNNRIRQIKVGGVIISAVDYTKGGLPYLTTLKSSSGADIATTQVYYDSLGRRSRSLTLRTSDGSTISDIRWEYNPRNLVNKITYYHLNNLEINIGYNLLGEVTSETTAGNASGNPSLVVPARTASYTYDKAGNRATQTIGGVTTTLVYNAESQLVTQSRSGWSVSHHYDVFGNEDERTTTESPYQVLEEFEYDYQNLMSYYIKTDGSSVTAVWQYDSWPTGERYSKKDMEAGVSTLYACHGDNVVADYSRSSSGSISLLNTYAQGLGLDQKSLRIPASGGRIHYLGDMVGTLETTLTDSGSKSQECVRDVWGVTLAGSTSNERYGFAQREHDMESGLVYMRHRMYDPRIGRFTQMDPVLGNRPHEHYRYAANNPVMMSDPNGLWPLPIELIRRMARQRDLERKHRDALVLELDFINKRAAEANSGFWNSVRSFWGGTLDETAEYWVRRRQIQGNTTSVSEVMAGWPAFAMNTITAVSPQQAYSVVVRGEDFISKQAVSPGERGLTLILIATPFAANRAIGALERGSLRTTTAGDLNVAAAVARHESTSGRGLVLSSQAFEDRVMNYLQSQGKTILGRQVSIQTDSTRIKPDFLTRGGTDDFVVFEAKGSATAPWTENQEIGFPELAGSGGLLKTRKLGSQGLSHGERLDNVSVIIVRPDPNGGFIFQEVQPSGK